MRITYRIFLASCIAISYLLTSSIVGAVEKLSAREDALYLAVGTEEECPPEGCPLPKKRPKPDEDEDEDDEDEEYEYEYEESELKEYQRIYYSFGMCGSYFAKKDDLDINGIIGALTNIEYRISKIFSFGFDSYYGYLAGSGNQYLSTFNPGFKIYPLAYKNPNFEPFLFFGGHAFDAIFGDNSVGRVGMGQGGYAGVGCRLKPESLPLGFEFFARASFLYMQRPKVIGGRGLAIPVLGFIGASY